ncbi:glucokinase [Catalinimonas alkaloidigena]|uniref:Glucokinase n=1 Tax=Catalinimonas alkaloidigena TaxID=1075417 RepID=A0A1G9TNL7_9BACT|nr:ROK family protein [Catalinimonas alkaloidigena]SDM49290.1 glucokinase [Catalinimonas alkaloidigena]
MRSIGVDIGGSHVSSCMYEHLDKTLLPETHVTLPVHPQASRETILATWAAAIRQTSASLHLPFQGVGIAMPGPFDYYHGIGLFQGVCKYESLYQANIREELSGRLNLPGQRVRFINDATAFSIAEARVGKTRHYARHVALTLGTGLGASFLIDGTPIIQGEQVPPGGYLYDKRHGDALADDVFSSRGLVQKYFELSGHRVEGVLAICQRIPTDQPAIQTFEWFGRELGRFLTPFLTRFRADVLIIGGNIAKAHPYFLATLTAHLPEVAIHISTFGEDSAMLGAALLLDDTYYEALATPYYAALKTI